MARNIFHLADRVRTVLESPAYQDTIGKWISEAREDAINKIANSIDVNELFAAKGELRGINLIIERIDSIFAEEKSAKNAKSRASQKEMNEWQTNKGQEPQTPQ
jgi:glycyl-tRNA synthetase beta subunit